MCQHNQLRRRRRQWIEETGIWNNDSFRKQHHSSHKGRGKPQHQALANAPCSLSNNVSGIWTLNLSHIIKRLHLTKTYLSPILIRGFLRVFPPSFDLTSPNFSVTTHSLTLLASSKPMNVALVRCNDMTFSNRIQKTNRWSDLQEKYC